MIDEFLWSDEIFTTEQSECADLWSLIFGGSWIEIKVRTKSAWIYCLLCDFLLLIFQSRFKSLNTSRLTFHASFIQSNEFISQSALAMVWSQQTYYKILFIFNSLSMSLFWVLISYLETFARHWKMKQIFRYFFFSLTDRVTQSSRSINNLKQEWENSALGSLDIDVGSNEWYWLIL